LDLGVEVLVKIKGIIEKFDLRLKAIGSKVLIDLPFFAAGFFI